MQVRTDEQGYITSYAIVGSLVAGVEIPDPADLTHFAAHFQAYTVSSGMAVFDEAKDAENQQAALREEYRQRRKTECFAVIDRSPFWYSTLTAEQTQQLQAWYQAWLEVTETLTVPEKPAWLS